MPRNASGTYSLPVASFIPGTTILSASANSNNNDIATALTQSLATTGVSSMTGPIKLAVGAINAPSMTFASDTTTGFYLVSAGTLGFVVGGANVYTASATAFTLPDVDVVLTAGNLGLTAGDIVVTNGDITATNGNIEAANGNIIDKNGALVYGTPVGLINDFGAASAPTGWLLCNGQAVSRTTFALLFAVLSTTWGVGNGTTTFNVPDLRGRVCAGDDAMGIGAAGRLTGASTGGCSGTLANVGGEQNHVMTLTELVTHHHGANQSSGNNSVSGAGVACANSFTSGGVVTADTGSSTAFNEVQPTAVTYKIIFAGA